MPIYCHRCESCGTYKEEFRAMAQSAEAPTCCNSPMGRVFTPPMVRADIQPFVSPTDGKTIINSRSQREEFMKRNNLVCAADMPVQRRVIKSTLQKTDVVEAVAKVQAGYKPSTPTVTIDNLSTVQ
jgi:hypothetical protein